MNCDKTDCKHYKVCEEWKSLGNDNYINESNGNCDCYSAPYNPTGDCISRDALIREIGRTDEWYKGRSICNIIDNAQAVEIDEQTYKDAYDQGYADGWKERYGEPDGRPKGEWIKVKENRMSIDMSGEIVTRYKCSMCGRLIATLPSKLVDYPFCHCGADMRKGGAE